MLCVARYLKKTVFYYIPIFNLDINKFILMLWKGVFLHAHRDGWEKFNRPSLPEKKGFPVT